MPVIFILNGILISLFAFDHNPPHIHVRCGEFKFTITLKDRIITGRCPSCVVKQVNDFMDSHIDELYALWEKAQKGGEITKIKR